MCLKYKKTIIFSVILFLFIPLISFAQNQNSNFPQTNNLPQNNTEEPQSSDFGLNYLANLNLPSGDPRQIIMNIISLLLGFMGILAIVIFIYGGFMLMVSGGDEDRISAARRLMVSAVIGIIIILSSYVMVSFIITFVNRSLQGGSTAP